MSQKANIIIVNWNGKKYLKDCLDAVFNQKYENFEVILVDNGSEDDSVEFVIKNYPETKIIKLKENTGYARGNNYGIEEALKDKNNSYIVLLNNDTIIDKNWLIELIKTAESDEKIGMAGSKALFKDGKVQTIGLSLEKNIHGYKEGGISIGYNEDGSRFNKEIEIFTPSGVSALYKREVIEKIGLFDENYFCYAEDLDLGIRARLVGYKCIYNPKSKLIHLHSKTAGFGSPFKAFYTKRNAYFIAFKYFTPYYLITFPFRDFYLNIGQILKKDNYKSVKEFKKKEGILGFFKLSFKICYSVIINLPKMIIKRYEIRKKYKINHKILKDYFNKFSSNNIENENN